MKVTLYRFSFSLPVLWYRIYLCIFFTFFLSSCSMLRLIQYLCVLFLLSVCPSVGLFVCFSVWKCLSLQTLSVLIYLCLSVRLPNLSHVSVFQAPSHVLPPNTQYGRSRSVCLSLLLLQSVSLFPTPSVSVCLSVSCFPVHCSHTCRVIFNRLAGVIMLAAPPCCCIYGVLE